MVDFARFTDLLFADQTLEELLRGADRIDLPTQSATWTDLIEAAVCLRGKDHARASELLLEIAASSNVETRVLLWSWTALRTLGVQPKAHEATQIQGVVIRVPMAGGFDVLAAYSDGTARYVNHSGKVIVWDLADAQVGAQISRVLESAKNLATIDAPRNRSNWPNDDIVRVALLTLNGNRLAEVEMRSLRASPISSVLTVAAELMANLIRRAQVTKPQ